MQIPARRQKLFHSSFVIEAFYTLPRPAVVALEGFMGGVNKTGPERGLFFFFFGSSGRRVQSP